jgi:carbamoyl-phosphate synthase small subunit
LALEDGTVFDGVGFGAATTAVGEVCFNTAMTGYQEVLTDPSYCGQIVALTAPHVGNTGVNDEDDQSRRPWVSGFVVREPSPSASSWRSRGELDDYLRRWNVPAIGEIDTRRLTRHLRHRGAMRGAIAIGSSRDTAIDMARSSPVYVGRDLVREVTTDHPYQITPSERRAEVRRVAALDFGLKNNILDLLCEAGCHVTVFPARTPAHSLLGGDFDGVFLSNGPGDPEPVTYAISTVRDLLGRVPVFGICLGHQILALALGARTYKLPFGHRGANHPVLRSGTEQVEITCQNHGFAVDEASLLGTGARLTHRNLNDQTVEGFEVPGIALAVQYHPEGGPGPHDSRYLFGCFRDLMDVFHDARLGPRAVATT